MGFQETMEAGNYDLAAAAVVLADPPLDVVNRAGRRNKMNARTKDANRRIGKDK
jgi:hypothetical protein